MPEPEPQQDSSTPPKWKALVSLRLVGTLRSRFADRRLLVPFAAAVLAVVGGVGMLFFLGEPPFDPMKLQQARDAMANGDLLEARTLATELAQLSTLTPQQRVDVDLVLGLAFARSAEAGGDETRDEYAQRAISKLRASLDFGVAPEIETEARFWLGRSYLFAEEIERAIDVFEMVADRTDAPRPDVDELLASAWLRSTSPNPSLALAYNDRALEADMSSSRHDRIILQRAEILLSLDRPAEARRIVAPMTGREDPAQAQFLLGRVALAEGRRLRQDGREEDQALANDLFREALRLFEIAEGRDTLRRQRIPGANYFRAQCLLELGEPEYALVQLDEIERRSIKSPEAIASGVLHAEILQNLGRPEQAVDKWQSVLQVADSVDPFRNPWITESEIAARLQQAVRQFWAKSDFEQASLLLRSDLHFIPRDESERLLSQTYEQHAESLRRQAATQGKEQSAATLLQARLAYQRAGHVYSRLARLKAATREYPDYLWASAQAYLAAEDAPNSIRMLEQFVEHDSTRERTAEALYFLAVSQLQHGEADAALRSARECVERFPKHPIRYQARLVASQASVELDDLEGAEAPLRENLELDLLTPRSSEWRQSLFDLGKLLYLEQKWSEAETRLVEAVRRFPNESQTPEARYLLAETLRQQAQLDRDRSATSAVESQRVGAARSALARLQDAVDQTESALSALLKVVSSDDFKSADEALLRNTSFLRAKLLAELNRHDEAAQAYMEFINRYYGRPETLDAYLAAATVFRQMDRESEARTAIAQAYETLQSLPSDAVLSHTSVGTKAQWETLLTWLQTL